MNLASAALLLALGVLPTPTTAFVVRSHISVTARSLSTTTSTFSTAPEGWAGAAPEQPESPMPPPLDAPPMSGGPMEPANEGPSGNQARKLWDEVAPVIIQGGSLKTWAYESPAVQRVQVLLKTEGRPLDADIELWQGPDNTPEKFRVYIEDGSLRPFSAVIETPRGPNTVAIYNIGQLEFPMDALVMADAGSNDIPSPDAVTEAIGRPPLTIQGGALKTWPFDPSVESVQVLLKTDGRPLNARIELLQGPNNIKQVMELYTEDGIERPFFAVIESPGSGNVVRVCNTATVEFPLYAWVEPFVIGDIDSAALEPILGGETNPRSPKVDLQW